MALSEEQLQEILKRERGRGFTVKEEVVEEKPISLDEFDKRVAAARTKREIRETRKSTSSGIRERLQKKKEGLSKALTPFGRQEIKGEVIKGFGKGALKTVKEESQLFKSIKNLIPEGLRDEADAAFKSAAQANPFLRNILLGARAVEKGEDVIARTEEVVGVEEGTLTTPEGLPQKVGFGAEKVTEFVAPIPGLAKTKTGVKAGKLLAPKFKGLFTRRSTESIAEKIAPKLNTKEARKIVAEGRAKKGKTSRLFGEAPDIVEQAEDIKRSAQTIERRIPGAEKMDDFTLNNEIKSEVSTIAQDLSPKMKRVSFETGDVRKAEKTWEKLKQAQSKIPEFEDAPSFKRSQRSFEKFLDEFTKPRKDKTGKFRVKNMDDVWNIRKRYDASIPERVKQADNLSPISSQIQKQMWLENRRILSDLLTDRAKGLGEAQKAFDEMSDLFRASKNIVSKAKIQQKRKPGPLSKETLTKRAAQGILGAAGVKFFFD